MSKPALRPGAKDILAALVIGSAGVIVLALQPLLYGPLVGLGLLDNTTLGLVAFLETLTLAVMTMAGPYYLRRGNFVWRLFSAGAAMLVLNVISTLSLTTGQFLVVRSLCGVTEGLIISGATLIFVSTPSPDRMLAVFLAVSTTIAGLISYFIPTWIIPNFGERSVFLILAAGASLAVAVSAALCFQPRHEDSWGVGWRSWPRVSFVLLLGVLLQNAAIGAAWAYLERVAAVGRFSAEELGLSASLSLAAQVTGAALVAVVAHRLPAALTLVFAGLLQAIAVFIVGQPSSANAFLFASVAMGFLWIGSFPYTLKLAVEVESTGQVAIYCVSAQMLGLALGPAVAALVVGSDGVVIAYDIAAILLIASAACYAIAKSSKLRAFADPAQIE